MGHQGGGTAAWVNMVNRAQYQQAFDEVSRQIGYIVTTTVTDEYVTQLLAAIEQAPRDLDLSFSNWTTANLAEYLATQTGIIMSARQVENYLKANGYRLRRPVRTVKHKQDPELVSEKKTDTYVCQGADA